MPFKIHAKFLSFEFVENRKNVFFIYGFISAYFPSYSLIHNNI